MASCRSAHPSFYDPTYYHKPSDRLACGNIRADHDEAGHCDSCDVCNQPLCPSDEGCKLFDGLAVHSDCLLADRRKAVLAAVAELLEAAGELAKVDEEALILPGDPREDLNAEAYDGIDQLAAWVKRNHQFLAAVAK